MLLSQVVFSASLRLSVLDTNPIGHSVPSGIRCERTAPIPRRTHHMLDEFQDSHRNEPIPAMKGVVPLISQIPMPVFFML